MGIVALFAGLLDVTLTDCPEFNDDHDHHDDDHDDFLQASLM